MQREQMEGHLGPVSFCQLQKSKSPPQTARLDTDICLTATLPSFGWAESLKLSLFRVFRPLSRGISFRALTMASLESQKLSRTEETEVQQWIATSEQLKSSPSDASILDNLNSHLASRTTLLGTKPSQADIAIYRSLAPTVKSWTPEQRTGQQGHPHILRHLDFVQNSSLFDLKVEEANKIKVDLDEVLYVKPPTDAKAEKERLKKEKAAAAAVSSSAAEDGAAATLVDRTKTAVEAVKDVAAGAKEKAVVGVPESTDKPKKEKKEKAPKPQKAPATVTPPSPSLIDLRVGHILKAIKHPEADSLYVSTIAMGDKPGAEDTTEYEGQVCRTVCSGLNGLVPLEEMQDRKVIVVANLKPVKMRGIKSCAMVLAASPRLKEGETDDHKGPVELVIPPADAKVGDRVCFDGWGGEPEGMLNPKKKIWETFQPGFTTTENLEVVFDGSLVKEAGKEEVGKLTTASGGICTVTTLRGATVR
ncbi:nucleic acid-binding protein [Durotheca rogersii]|uniref:nucleic acid-binding protein n=1 Tax=Durotheca rogersii TaxID=419775 RepID=UPI002220F775|nr:nucleic acid-binding protein [Durotheca rogersii]KAI5868487.1 nucleic acid-binding protein [Durotheca rogersii]